MAVVYLGLGSNLGDRKKNLNNVLRLLASTHQIAIKHLSHFYRTKPMYVLDQPYFLNAAAKIQTTLDPEELMLMLKTIEKKMGRTCRQRYGPRMIDIDILMYGRKIIQTSYLHIPHQRMHERFFVLKPLAEIAPFAVHPLLNKRIKTLLRIIESDPCLISIAYDK